MSRSPINFSSSTVRALRGIAGDTLASALLANGQRLIGRSFKYHRPRGIVTAGPEEPCALVDVLGARGREPNRIATTLSLARRPGGREPEPLAVAAFRCDGGQRSAFAVPARGLLLQDVHGSRLGMGAGLRAADPSGSRTRATRGQRGRTRRSSRDGARSHRRARDRRRRRRARRCPSPRHQRAAGDAPRTGCCARWRRTTGPALDTVARKNLQRVGNPGHM